MMASTHALKAAAKSVTAGLLTLVAVPAVAAGLDFATAKRLADAAHDDAYAQRWTDANNSQHLDEKDNCYFKSPGPLRQVLVIDTAGEVTGVIADRNNAKAACFRGSYLHAHFPPPPSAPYYQYLFMADPQAPADPR
ncbi:MAG TPA: hypothetical protein VFA75_12565 [Nevskia sp.]|nr:hypothetical protein [Nevskia sp.]